jgi:hypothetical protein
MNSIDKKALDKLKEEYKDVLENPAIESLINLKRMGDRGLILTNHVDYPEMSEKKYVQKFKDSLSYLLKRL